MGFWRICSDGSLYWEERKGVALTCFEGSFPFHSRAIFDDRRPESSETSTPSGGMKKGICGEVEVEVQVQVGNDRILSAGSVSSRPPDSNRANIAVAWDQIGDDDDNSRFAGLTHIRAIAN